MVCRLSIAVPSLALVCLVALASLPAPALAGKAPWCSPPGGPWRQLPAQGNISQTLADAIVTDFLDNQQANSSFSPCVKDELKTTILGCVRVSMRARCGLTGCVVCNVRGCCGVGGNLWAISGRCPWAG
ncbi:hypothetical protein ABPG75_004394 [Micractinium tetrahymenae]